MTDLGQLTKLSDAHAAQRDSIIAKLLKALLGLWSGFDYWSDPHITTGMAAKSATLVDSATLNVRRLERSYTTAVLKRMDVRPTELPPIANGYPRANVTPVEVYRRPVERFLWARKNGVPFEQATDDAIARLQELAERDVLTAARDEDQLVYEASKQVLGYRRIVHPELSRSGSCGLCLAAAANRYRVADLLPLHSGCNCDTLPITEGDDPGFRLNQDDLKKLYAAASSSGADDLLNVRATVNEHGELGPVLVKQGDHFRTPAEAGRPDYVPQTREQIRADRQRELDDLRGSLADAESAYADYVAANPGSLAPGGDNAQRIALFRATKQMRERVEQLDRFLRSFAT